MQKKLPQHVPIVQVNKWPLLLILALFFSFTANAQTVTLKLKNATVKKVLREASRQSKVSIVYNEAILEGLKPINIDVKNAAVKDVLDLCLPNPPFNYTVEGNLITIRKYSTKELQEQGVAQGAVVYVVSGTVTDKSAKPMEKSTVEISGPQNRSTFTDVNGVFVFRVPAGRYNLTVSNVASEKFQTEFKVGEKPLPPLAIEMKEKINQMEDVVVNGIYSRPKDNFTGSATAFTGAQLREISPKSIIDALKTLDASFQVPRDNVNGSNPNVVPRVQVRGTNSIMQTDLKSEYGYISNPPLVIIDGFESTIQVLYDMDINRVANITILKDAAATAVYGSKSANGVLVVQTIQPKPGKVQTTYTTSLEINMPDLGSFNLMNAREKIEYERIAGMYRSRNFTTQRLLDDKYNLVLHNVEKGVNSYWLSQPLQTEINQAHNLSIGAGTENFMFNGTLSYRHNGGVMKGSNRDNLEGTLNMKYTTKNQKFTLQGQFQIGTLNSNNSPYGDFAQYTRLNPYWMVTDSHGEITKYVDVYDPDGSNGLITSSYTPTVVNPLYNTTLHTVDQTKSLKIGQNIWAEWTLASGLKLNSTFGFSTSKDQTDVFMPGSASQFFNETNFAARGTYDKRTSNTNQYQSNTTFNYGKMFGKHTIYATGGVSIQENSGDALLISAKGFPSGRLDDLLYGLNYSTEKPSGSYNITRNVGFLGNASYAFDNRYLFDASYRSDGSSVYGADKRFGTLWALGAGWNIHKEHFINLPDAITRLKLRGSYGYTGSVNFPSYAAVTTYQYTTTGRYLDYIPANIVAMGNPDLLWQRTKKLNIGTDIGLFNDRVTISAEVYNETTDDLIMENQSPLSTGFSSYFNNLGKSRNKGYELTLSAFILKNPARKLFWSMSTSFYKNKNTLLEITDALKTQNQEALDLQKDGYTKPVLQYEEGKSVSTLYAVRSLGIDASNGYEVFLTKDGKQTYIWNQADEVALGDMQPKINLTLNNNFQYKWIRLNFGMVLKLGGVEYNSTLADKVENGDMNYNIDRRALKDRWQTPGVPADFKGLTDLEGYTRPLDPTVVTSRFVRKSNTIEITGISLDPGALLEKYINRYTNRLVNKLNNKAKDALHSNMVDVRFYMNNAFTISSLKREQGTSYPLNRSYTLNITLYL